MSSTLTKSGNGLPVVVALLSYNSGNLYGAFGWSFKTNGVFLVGVNTSDSNAFSFGNVFSTVFISPLVANAVNLSVSYITTCLLLNCGLAPIVLPTSVASLTNILPEGVKTKFILAPKPTRLPWNIVAASYGLVIP